jgi:hypothetical protein
MLAILVGFLGGFLANWSSDVQPAFAEKRSQPVWEYGWYSVDTRLWRFSWRTSKEDHVCSNHGELLKRMGVFSVYDASEVSFGATLNYLGSKGWELVHYESLEHESGLRETTFIFKRRLS